MGIRPEPARRLSLGALVADVAGLSDAASFRPLASRRGASPSQHCRSQCAFARAIPLRLRQVTPTHSTGVTIVRGIAKGFDVKTLIYILLLLLAVLGYRIAVSPDWQAGDRRRRDGPRQAAGGSARRADQCSSLRLCGRGS